MLVIRSAKTSDVKAIRELVDSYAAPGQMLAKETVTLYEGVQEFTVAELDGRVVGCGALHTLWEDLAEVRTVAVERICRSKELATRFLKELLNELAKLELKEFSVLHFKQSSLVATDLKRFMVHPSILRSINSCCAPTTQV